MKTPVSLSAVAVVSLVLLFAGIAVVGAQNLHATASLGVTGDDNTNTCTPTPVVTARATRTPKPSVAPGAVGTVHAELFIGCITASPTPSPSAVPVTPTARTTRTPRPPISTSQAE